MRALAALVAEEARQGVAPDPLRRLAALLPPDPRVAEQVAARLRLSAAQKKRLVTAADRAQRARRCPRARLSPRARARRSTGCCWRAPTIAPLAGWDIPEFPLKGGEIVARGVSAGPEVARILHAVEDRWVAEGLPRAASGC